MHKTITNNLSLLNIHYCKKYIVTLWADLTDEYLLHSLLNNYIIIIQIIIIRDKIITITTTIMIRRLV